LLDQLTLQMPYKLHTNLANFRFNRTHHTTSLSVDWYKYDLDENIEENISPLSYPELKEFEGFAVSLPFNFPGNKDYSIIMDHQHPFEILDDLIFSNDAAFPECVILKPEPKLLLGNNCARFSQIVLFDTRGKDHLAYGLSFGVIGMIKV